MKLLLCGSDSAPSSDFEWRFPLVMDANRQAKLRALVSVVARASAGLPPQPEDLLLAKEALQGHDPRRIGAWVLLHASMEVTP